MKKNLLQLINKENQIRDCAVTNSDSSGFDIEFEIYNVPQFIEWKEAIRYELQAVSPDKYIVRVLELIDSFNGWNDKNNFNNLVAMLNVIKNNIDHYYPEENIMREERKKVIFISHAASDKCYIQEIVELLENIGLRENDIVCSSVPPYGIPLGSNIYQWLVERFQTCDLHVIFALSHNYYNSVACLNEMGAAWATKQKWTSILLPGFDFSEVKGCVDNGEIGIKLDDIDRETLNFRLGELKDAIVEEFGLSPIEQNRWERVRNNFIRTINSIAR